MVKITEINTVTFEVNNVTFEVHQATAIMVNMLRWVSPPFLEAMLRERVRQIKTASIEHSAHFFPSTATLNNAINYRLTEKDRKNKAYVDLLTFVEVNYRFFDWYHYSNSTTIDMGELQDYIKTEKTTEERTQLHRELAGKQEPCTLLRFLNDASTKESEKLRKEMRNFATPPLHTKTEEHTQG